MDDANHLALNISLTPEMAEIIERMRGTLSAERFLYTLLKIADTGAIRKPPGGNSESEVAPKTDPPAGSP